VQILCVVEAKLTGSPEDAVAVSVRLVPAICAAIGPKAMVWLVVEVPPPNPDELEHPVANNAIPQRIEGIVPRIEERIVPIASPAGCRTDFES